MFYREVGQFKTTYAADQAIFPIRQDRIGLALILFVAFVGIPLVAGEFMIASVMVPFLVLSLAAIGLNILIGYTGLISLGTAAFMGVGAIACYKLSTIFPQGIQWRSCLRGLHRLLSMSLALIYVPFHSQTVQDVYEA